MITEQELQSAIVAVEQSIRDAEEAKVTGKRDVALLKELSIQILIDKTKLQVLHYAQGITSMITEKDLENSIKKAETFLELMCQPEETDLFESPGENAKATERIKLVMRTRLFTLRYIAGQEKKIL